MNEELVRQLFGQESALSKRVKLGSDSDSPWMTIVGVVGNVRHSALTTAADPELYVPLAQAPPSMMMLAAKGDAHDLTEQMRASVRAVDPLQPVYHVKTLQALVDDSTLVSRASASTMALFGVLALVLANVGVYGVVAYGVSQQTKEFGVRAALGATPRDLMRLVIGGGLAMVGTGIAVGLAGALAVSQLLEATLVGVGPADPLTYAMTFCVLAASGLLACAVPAWRASATQPVIALRTE